MENRILELMRLNEEQLAALDLERSILVEANAGSGKTSAIVARYLRILEEGRAKVDEILAITFTENAASEMRERIGLMIKEYIKSYGEFENISRESIRRLPRAPISTIHGFAARILRENPFESSLSPNFNIIEGIERRIFVEEALFAFVMDLWESQKMGDLEVLLPVLSEEGYDFKSVIEKLISIITQASTLHLEPPWKVFSDNVERNADHKTLLVCLLQDIQTKLIDSNSKVIRNRIEKIRDLVFRLKSHETKSIRARLLSEIKDNLGSNGVLSLSSASDEEVQLAGYLLEMVNKILNMYEAELSDNYLKLAERAYYFLEKRKLDAGYVEYEDLLRNARRSLLSNPRLLRYYRRKFRFIMLDEFQDTDSLQFEIIGMLSQNGVANTFIVGDPKQSIFRFRGADIDVFYKLKRNSKNLEKFQNNYRSEGGLVGYYNCFFDILLKDINERMNPTKGIAHKKSNIEIIFNFDEKPSIAREKEADAVAKRILWLNNEGHQFKEIAIIFRSISNMYLVENALRKHRIPYFSSSGTGFFGQQEIRDVVIFIKYLLNPEDRISEACVLRSLFLGSSDDELMAHFTKQKKIGRIDEYLEFISGLRREIVSLTPLSLLEFILGRTGYDSALLALPDGRGRYANIKKLFGIFARLESLGYSLDEILEYIDSYLLEDSEPLVQAEMEEDDSVKILTVHKSKGLEFPVVILSDLNHGTGGGNEKVIARRDSGFLIRYEKTSSQLWEGINELEFNEILEEEKRLLYVAKTRAKELLILSFSGQRKKDGDMRISKSSFADLIGSVFKIRIEDDNQEITSVLGFGIPIWNSKDDLTFKTGLDKEGAPEPHEIEEIAMSVQKYEAQSFPIGVVDEEPIIRQLGDELSALEVGALMHRFLQIWDFKKKSIRKTVRFVLNEGYVVDDSLEEILIKLGEDFLSSELFERINNADSYDREIPFYMEIDAMPERRKIDLMIKEGDRISLFDYKYTSKGKIEEKELSEYKSQLELYGKAVEKHFGRYPKEKTLVFLPDIELIRIL